MQEDDAVGRKVTFTIEDGYLDLTGSNKWDHLGGAAGGAGNADLNIQYGWDPVTDMAAGEEYVINFVGPGSITVDEGGILVGRQIAAGEDASAFDIESLTTPRTYEYLWDEGILQANGMSGLDGAIFADFFTTENNLGDENYKLISNIGAGVPGDFNGDQKVDGADFLVWQQDLGDAASLTAWEENYGAGASAQLSSVPEPNTVVLFAATVMAGWIGGARKRRVR